MVQDLKDLGYGDKINDLVNKIFKIIPSYYETDQSVEIADLIIQFIKEENA